MSIKTRDSYEARTPPIALLCSDACLLHCDGSRSDRSTHDATGPRWRYLEAITEHNRSVLAMQVAGIGWEAAACKKLTSCWQNTTMGKQLGNSSIKTYRRTTTHWRVTEEVENRFTMFRGWVVTTFWLEKKTFRLMGSLLVPFLFHPNIFLTNLVRCTFYYILLWNKQILFISPDSTDTFVSENNVPWVVVAYVTVINCPYPS